MVSTGSSGVPYFTLLAEASFEQRVEDIDVFGSTTQAETCRHQTHDVSSKQTSLSLHHRHRSPDRHSYLTVKWFLSRFSLSVGGLCFSENTVGGRSVCSVTPHALASPAPECSHQINVPLSPKNVADRRHKWLNCHIHATIPSPTHKCSPSMSNFLSMII